MPASTENLQKAKDNLISELSTNDRYRQYETKPIDETLIAAYIQKLAEVLEEKNKTEKEYTDIRQKQGWSTWIKGSVQTTPEYTAYKKKQDDFDAQLQNIQKEYIQKSRELDAKKQAVILNITKNPTAQQELEQLICKQIVFMEKNLDGYWTNINYSHNPETKTQEIQQIAAYKQFLKNNGIIEAELAKFPGFTELQQQYGTQISPLIDSFATSYAQHMFFKTNEKLFYEPVNNPHIDFFKTAVTKEEANKDFLFTKIQLLCRYAQSKEYKTIDEKGVRIEQLLADLNPETTTTIDKTKALAKANFDSIPGSYMLSDAALKQQFLDELFFIHQQRQMILRKDPTSKTTHLAFQDKEAELYVKINAAIDKATETYQIPPATAAATNSTDGWLFGNQDIRQKALANAKETLNGIAGNDLLSETQKNLFLNKLCVLEEKELQGKNQQYPLIGRLMPYKEAQKDECKKQIQETIHKTFESDPQIKQDIETYKSLYGTNQIGDQKLRVELDKQLSESIVNKKKSNKRIPPLPNTATEPTEVLSNVEIAKTLDKIDSFKDLALDQQLACIDKLKSNLKHIAETDSEISRLKPSASADSKIAEKITNLEKYNDLNRKTIKQIIDDIVFNAFKKDETALKIAENSWRDTASDYWESTKAFLKHPTTQGVAAGVAIGATAALVAPAANMLTAIPGVSHIPGVGQAISGVATLGSGGPVAGMLAGGAAGYMFPKIAAVFKPFKYLYNEVKDIITKPKSYFDRAFRGGAILTSTVGMAVGIGFLVALAANPFSGPVVGGIIAGVFATALVAAGTAKAASFISKKVSKYRYGAEDIDLYEPTEQAKNTLGGAENAQKVSDYFKKEISALQDKFNNYPDQETISGIKLGDQLDYLKSTWSKLQKGDSSNWEYLSRVLYKEKMEGCKTTVEQINTSDITNTLLELVTAPKSAKPDDLSPARIVAGPERKSLSFSKHKEAVAEFDTGMKDLRDVNAIIMAAKNK